MPVYLPAQSRELRLLCVWLKVATSVPRPTDESEAGGLQAVINSVTRKRQLLIIVEPFIILSNRQWWPI
jgi:hypothetical protein